MKSAHTPAPWRVLAHGGAMYQVEEHTHTEARGIDEDGQPCEWSEWTDATARLIAAAPDLLAALDAMTHYFGDYEKDDAAKYVFRAARAAIAKATGELA